VTSEVWADRSCVGSLDSYRWKSAARGKAWIALIQAFRPALNNETLAIPYSLSLNALPK
jgi:hypothetical protein